jgi:hypothetical protein
MSQAGRVEALKAAFRGVVRAGEPLDGLRERVERLSETDEPDAGLLADLTRIGAGVAVAAAALRSLGESFSQGSQDASESS